MFPIRAIAWSLLALVVAACSSESPAAPSSAGGITTPRDSTAGSFYAGMTDIGGKVYIHIPSTAKSDSQIVAPVGSTTIKLSRNDKVDGSGGFSYLTETTPAADGTFSFKGVPAGFYLLGTTTQLGQWSGAQSTYVVANTASVIADVNLYHN